ncbi:hypothetical protein PVAP13_2KG496315 [Panicum virgatum]|uniref:Uncharacterized protein n=1 Tax=Panicum virgatum TaxID=38727 RepID=A0A8T0W9S7_PANVG|nr:hypothetical protein PVAP13_2KG496315 [Panicum virgatum]
MGAVRSSFAARPPLPSSARARTPAAPDHLHPIHHLHGLRLTAGDPAGQISSIPAAFGPISDGAPLAGPRHAVETPSDTPHRAWNPTIELAVSWGTCSLRRSTSSPPGCALSTATSPLVHVVVVAVHRRSPPVSSSSCGKKQGDGERTIGRTLRTTPSTPSPPSSPARAGPPPAEHLLLPCHEEEEGGGGREGCFMINPLASLCFPCYLLNTIH